MGRNNYRNFYKEKVDEEKKVEDPIEESNNDIIDEDEKVEDPIEESNNDIIDEDEEEKSEIIGVVSNCERLNVRNNPLKRSAVLTIIDKDTEVIIEDEKSNNLFYKIRINDIVGYCMKEFIEIK